MILNAVVGLKTKRITSKVHVVDLNHSIDFFQFLGRQWAK